MSANFLSPAMPLARRSAVNVFPDPVPPARPIKSGTFSRTAGRKLNAIAHLAIRPALLHPRRHFEVRGPARVGVPVVAEQATPPPLERDVHLHVTEHLGAW